MKQLITKTELIQALKEQNIKTKKGAEITLTNINAMVLRNKIPYYQIANKAGSKGSLFFVYEEVEKALTGRVDSEVDFSIQPEDEFEEMILKAEELGVRFSEYIKSKEVYQAYKMKELDIAIKRREYIPIQEVYGAFEVSVTNLKTKLYNLSAQFKQKFPNSSQEELDYIYKKIDDAFANIYNSVEELKNQ